MCSLCVLGSKYDLEGNNPYYFETAIVCMIPSLVGLRTLPHSTEWLKGKFSSGTEF